MFYALAWKQRKWKWKWITHVVRYECGFCSVKIKSIQDECALLEFHFNSSCCAVQNAYIKRIIFLFGEILHCHIWTKCTHLCFSHNFFFLVEKKRKGIEWVKQKIKSHTLIERKISVYMHILTGKSIYIFIISDRRRVVYFSICDSSKKSHLFVPSLNVIWWR